MSSKPLVKFEKIAEEHPFFLDPEETPHWRELFGNDHPLVFEVGFGNGNFLLDMAVRYPDLNFVGMDFYHKGIRRLFMRIDRYRLTNIRIVYGDAREKIPFLFREEELSDIYVNFPDPWPKKRHHKRRLIKPPIVQALCESLQPEGRIRVATDFESYAMEILEVLSAEPGLRNVHSGTGFVHQREDVPRSKYEKNFLREGKTIYYFDFIKPFPARG